MLEWTVAALSAAMVLALVGFLLHDALTRSPSPPDLDVRSDSVVSVGAGYLVAVTVSNGGGRTAASVQLRGELLQGDSVLETSEAVLDYVPVGAHRHAGLQFELDPEAPTLVGATVEDVVDRWIFSGNRPVVETVCVDGEMLVSGGRHRDRDAVAARYRRAIDELVST